MRIKKELGSGAVRDLVERASARSQERPERSVRDPWPSSSRVISESVVDDVAPTHARGPEMSKKSHVHKQRILDAIDRGEGLSSALDALDADRGVSDSEYLAVLDQALESATDEDACADIEMRADAKREELAR